MTIRGIVALSAAAGAACAAGAQPATEIRFSNGTNVIAVAPGAAVPVQVWAVGLPDVGTPIPWTTPPGTGENLDYVGFGSVFMDVTASGGSWSRLSFPPVFSPWGTAGTINGSNVNSIGVGVGSGPPMAGNSLLLWTGTITVGSSDINVATLIRPWSNHSQFGFEVYLSHWFGYMNQFVPTTNGSAAITVPGPGGVALIGLGGLAGARRRRSCWEIGP